MTTAVELYQNPEMLEQFTKSIGAVLPSFMPEERMVKIGLTQLRKNKKLGLCSPASFAKCMLQLAELGLEPGDKAHLIPFKDECTLIIDYKGYIDLVRRSGEVDVVKAITIKRNDKFSWKNGTISHEIDPLKDRGELVGVYSFIQYKSGVKEYGEPMGMEALEDIRKRSMAGNRGPWKTDTEEMYKKTVIRRDRKYWPCSPLMSMAIDVDGDRIKEIPKEEVIVDSRLGDLLEEKA